MSSGSLRNGEEGQYWRENKCEKKEMVETLQKGTPTFRSIKGYKCKIMRQRLKLCANSKILIFGMSLTAHVVWVSVFLWPNNLKM